MKRKHKMFYSATILALLMTLSGAAGSGASPKDSVPEGAGIQAGNEYNLVRAGDASAGGEIIPGDRKIDWSYAGIPGGIPERTGVCATIDSAVYGNGATDATGAIQDAIDDCPAGQVVYVPEGTYIVNDVVDPVGVEGKCTYCGYEGGDRVLGQFVEVTAVNGNQVTLNLPLHWTYDTDLDPWAYQVDAYAMIRNAGLEDLTLTQDNPEVEFVIEMDGAQYSWIKNVEIKNIQRRGMWIIDSLQNEIRECYVHIGIDGYGRDRGYGMFVDLHSSNNLVENNILSTIDGGGIMTGGGASGNVIAYNYLHDILF